MLLDAYWNCKDNTWKKLRDPSIFATDKAAFLSKYSSAMKAVEDSRYNDHDEYDYTILIMTKTVRYHYFMYNAREMLYKLLFLSYL